jgi:MYB-related transcription factor LHY
MVKKKVPKDGSHKAEKWTSEEHQQFIEAVRAHGKNWTKVAEMIPTRDRPAIASHSQ